MRPCLLRHNPHEFPNKKYQWANQVEWKGRWQKLKLNSKLSFLIPHNTEARLQLEENLFKHIAESGKPIIATGILGNERAQDISPSASQNAHSLYLCRTNQPRSCCRSSVL